MAFEQIRIFLGLDTSAVAKGLAKARAEIKAQSGKVEKAGGAIGLGGAIEAIKSPLGAATAALAGIVGGLKMAGERAQTLRDISIETGTTLDRNTRIVAALGDRFTSVGNKAKGALATYAKYFELGLEAFGASRDTGANKTAGQAEALANTARERAIQDAILEAKNATLLVDDKINAKAVELGKLRSRQLDDAEALKDIDTSTDAGAALAGKLQLQMNARNLEIIQKEGALNAEKLSRSREIAASEIALQQSITAANSVNATHAYKMDVLEKEAVALEKQKAKYSGDITKQNELQAQANGKRTEAARAEKEYKLQIYEINRQVATLSVSVLLNNDLRRVELLREQAAEHRKVAAMLYDEVDRAGQLTQAQQKENEAIMIGRSLRARVLDLQLAINNANRDFKNVGMQVLSTDLERAKALREQADDAKRLADLEQDKEVRAQKLLAAQQLMTQAVAAELKTRTQLSGIGDIARLGGGTERGRMARKAQKLYEESQVLEAKGQFGEVDRRRARAQAIEGKLIAGDRSRLMAGVSKTDAKAGQDANLILTDMKTSLKNIDEKLSPKKLK